jgi:hypothetical protein
MHGGGIEGGKTIYKNNVTKFSGLTNTTDIWRAAKSITSPRTVTELKLKVGSDIIQEQSTVAEVFNDYFVTKVEDLIKKIDATNLPDPLSKAKFGIHSQFILGEVSEQHWFRSDKFKGAKSRWQCLGNPIMLHHQQINLIW